MSHVTQNQPDGTPTWIDLGIPDLDRAMAFYGALFGWEFEVGLQEYGYYTICLLDGRRAAALAPNPDPAATEFWWNVYLATDDVDATDRSAPSRPAGEWSGSRSTSPTRAGARCCATRSARSSASGKGAGTSAARS